MNSNNRSIVATRLERISPLGFLDGVAYIMPQNGQRRYLGATALKLSTIEQEMENSPAGHRLLLVDACQERVSADSRHLAGTAAQAMTAPFDEELKKPTGQSKLTSCTVGQFSYEHPELGDVGHGVFTFALLEALRGGAPPDAQNVIRLGAVSQYVSARVVQWVADENRRAAAGQRARDQKPAFYGPEQGRLLPSSVNWRLYVPRPPAPPPPVEAKRPHTLETTIGMKLVLIPAGEFLMGSSEGDSIADDDEQPQHRVRITKPFYLGVTEVTQEQYERMMGTNPSNFKGVQLPVESVSWEDAVAFCRKLSEKEGRTYRLPTEAEWEYSCRAGSTTKWCFGDDESLLKDYAWYDVNANSTTHPVGEKRPNAWGLYDMHGNVWEWCSDGLGDYASTSVDDPTGSAAGSFRVFRGGSWLGGAWGCRSAYQSRGAPVGRGSLLGFRVACSVDVSGQ